MSEDTKVTGTEDNDDDATVLADPRVQRALEDRISRARREHEESVKGLKTKNQELLGKLTKFKDIDPEAVTQTARELEELRTKIKGGELGHDPNKYASDVEAAAKAKFEDLRREQQNREELRQSELESLKEQVATLERDRDDAFLTSEFYRACIPEDQSPFEPGVWPYLQQALKGVVVKKQVEGIPFPVARVKDPKDPDRLVASNKTPDGYMDMRELISQTRQGQGPLKDIQSFFRSVGRGSGTAGSSSRAVSSKSWHKMTPEERAAFSKEHGAQETESKIREAIREKNPKAAAL